MKLSSSICREILRLGRPATIDSSDVKPVRQIDRRQATCATLEVWLSCDLHRSRTRRKYALQATIFAVASPSLVHRSTRSRSFFINFWTSIFKLATTMYIHTLPLLLLAATSLCTPTPTAEPNPDLEKRQQNLPQLLTLASLAGITALPTNPTVLIALGPVAQQLAAALPTSSVLSVLETAAPPSFLSNIVHDPSYASSFESAFAAGSSPSWFKSLPTDVRSYLHTYTGFAGIATAAAEFNNVTRNASAMSTGSMTGTSSTGSSTGMSTSGTSSATAAGGSTASSKLSSGGAAKQTGAITAGIAGVVGILGVAAAL